MSVSVPFPGSEVQVTFERRNDSHFSPLLSSRVGVQDRHHVRRRFRGRRLKDVRGIQPYDEPVFLN